MTAEQYRRFDPADYLADIEDVAGYLQLAFEESADDPTAVPRALGVIAGSGNMSKLARRVGMSRDGLYQALSEQGNPPGVHVDACAVADGRHGLTHQ